MTYWHLMLKAQALPSLSTFVVNFFYSLLNKLFSLFKTIFLDQYTLFLPIDLAFYFCFLLNLLLLFVQTNLIHFLLTIAYFYCMYTLPYKTKRLFPQIIPRFKPAIICNYHKKLSKTLPKTPRTTMKTVSITVIFRKMNPNKAINNAPNMAPPKPIQVTPPDTPTGIGFPVTILNGRSPQRIPNSLLKVSESAADITDKTNKFVLSRFQNNARIANNQIGPAFANT